MFYAPDILTTHELPADEALHAVRVLRLRAGDTLTIVDGQGHICDAVLTSADGHGHCRVEITDCREQTPLWSGHLHLAIAPTKNADRMEWLVEKATEVGVDEISFLDCRNSERHVLKLDRLQRVAVAAIKQSLKARLPRLNTMTDFARFVERPFNGQKFIAHCHEGGKADLASRLSHGEDVLTLIGPEGDFSADEVSLAESLGYEAVSLGRARLRTETAALVAATLMSLSHQHTP